MPKVGQEYEFTTEQLRNFQDLFIKAREDLGKSQSAVAEETGLKQTWISSIERATYPSFNLLDILKLCQYYGIMPNQVSNALGFLEHTLNMQPDEAAAVSNFQRLFHHLTPERKRLAIVLVRQVLMGLVAYYHDEDSELPLS